MKDVQEVSVYDTLLKGKDQTAAHQAPVHEIEYLVCFKYWSEKMISTFKHISFFSIRQTFNKISQYN
jgi:hypothetical protein